MKKIIYIANIRLPTEKAHGIQVMKTCEAFAEAGVDVELVFPRRYNHIKDNPFAYYGVRKIFSITWVPCLDLVHFGRIGFFVQSLTFSLVVLLRYYGLKKRMDTVFYSRDEVPSYVLSLFGIKVVWEAHMGHYNFFIRSLIRHDVPLVLISGGLSDLYRSYGAKSTLIAPDGVDLKQFQITESRDEARLKLGLPAGVKLIVYTGHLYSWKGADVLAEASPKLSNGVYSVFVGGTEKDIAVFKNKYGHIKNIMILGRKPHHEIPLYLRAADVLVIPNSAKEKISRLYTSPMKLFEYMASGTPIVASKIPSICEVLNERNSVLVQPDSPSDLARGVNMALIETRETSEMAGRALEDVKQFSWIKRAEGIINFVSL